MLLETNLTSRHSRSCDLLPKGITYFNGAQKRNITFVHKIQIRAQYIL